MSWGQDPRERLRKLHARLFKDVDAIAALPLTTPEEAASRLKKIQAVMLELAKANAIVASGQCTVLQLGQHLELANKLFAVATSANDEMSGGPKV
jgi:hypothetical protein